MHPPGVLFFFLAACFTPTADCQSQKVSLRVFRCLLNASSCVEGCVLVNTPPQNLHFSSRCRITSIAKLQGCKVSSLLRCVVLSEELKIRLKRATGLLVDQMKFVLILSTELQSSNMKGICSASLSSTMFSACDGSLASSRIGP